MGDHHEQLHQVTCRILEDWAFLMPETAPDARTRLDREALRLHAAVRFDGEEDGVVEVATTPTLIATLLANLLGPGDHLADGAAVSDAIGELVNILGAHLLDARWGRRASFARLPEVRASQAGEPLNRLSEAEILGFDIGGEPLAIFIQSPVPA